MVWQRFSDNISLICVSYENEALEFHKMQGSFSVGQCNYVTSLPCTDGCILAHWRMKYDYFKLTVSIDHNKCLLHMNGHLIYV